MAHAPLCVAYHPARTETSRAYARRGGLSDCRVLTGWRLNWRPSSGRASSAPWPAPRSSSPGALKRRPGADPGRARQRPDERHVGGGTVARDPTLQRPQPTAVVAHDPVGGVLELILLPKA